MRILRSYPEALGRSRTHLATEDISHVDVLSHLAICNSNQTNHLVTSVPVSICITFREL